MRKFSIIVFCLLISMAIAACSGPCKRGAGSQATGDAAKVGGVAITMSELDDAASGQLQKVQTQIYQIKKRTLDNLVEEKLLESAAAKVGKSKDEYVKSEVDEKVEDPSEKEVKALYEARKGKFKQPFEEVKGQLTAYLQQNRKSRARRDLISKLRTDANVEIILEPPRIEVEIDEAQILGDKNAKITLVEFSDYQCPFCKRVRPTIWRLLDEYKGKVNYVFMDFPLSFHREAKKAHEAARCAGDQGKYYEYNRKLFDNQKSLSVEELKKYAKQLNLDTNEFDKCLDSGKHAKTVEENMSKGVGAGVSGTPAFFINGIMLSGAQPHTAFKEVIEGELNR
ncbi:MAG: thioredoxin domain-containing protein [Deltaproteobacteria bacterium]|jgi:protein-disulfide isomerase|nr:thioredoxin domain-containing protein [Deltaproteobacteria bacterium]